MSTPPLPGETPAEWSARVLARYEAPSPIERHMKTMFQAARKRHEERRAVRELSDEELLAELLRERYGTLPARRP
jgi:hypothetical protein